jgi:hypothetical protein
MVTEREFVLGVDLDGVVADFKRGLKPIAAEWLGVKEESLTDEISYGFPEWNLDACGGLKNSHQSTERRRRYATCPPRI